MGRLGYDGDESLYFDRERPICAPFVGEEQQYEECNPIEVCDALESRITVLEETENLAWDSAIDHHVAEVADLKREHAEHVATLEAARDTAFQNGWADGERAYAERQRKRAFKTGG